jgi:hypothetical protein
MLIPEAHRARQAESVDNAGREESAVDHGYSPRKRRAFGLVDATRRKLTNQSQLLRVGVGNQVRNERELHDHWVRQDKRVEVGAAHAPVDLV